MKWCVLFLMALSLGAADERHWEFAVLTEMHKVNGGHDWSYTFDEADRTIICVDPPMRIRIKPLDIQVGKPVKFARSKNSCIVIDLKGKEQHLEIQQEALK